MRWRILIISLLICLITAGCSETSTLTLEEKVADFEQLYNEDKVGYIYIHQMNSASGSINDDMKKL